MFAHGLQDAIAPPLLNYYGIKKRKRRIERATLPSQSLVGRTYFLSRALAW
jgi:hypothetical protein